MIWIVLGAIAIPFLLYGLHRFACALEDAGYLRYRNNEEGTGGGGTASATLGEIDKITRPNAERIVTEAKEEQRIVIKKVERE